MVQCFAGCIFSIFGPTTTFIHTKQNLVPYTQYEFRIVAKNTHGETRSSWSRQTTRQDSMLVLLELRDQNLSINCLTWRYQHFCIVDVIEFSDNSRQL